MNVLCHGAPFCSDWPVLDHYEGAHTIRRFGSDDVADIQYDPAADDMPTIIDRLENEFPVDLVLFWTPDIYPPPDRVEDAPCKTIALVSDWNVSYDLLARNLGRYDIVASDKVGAREILNRHGICPHYITPLYCAHPIHHQPLGLARDIDILFLGNIHAAGHEYRSYILSQIATWPTEARIVISSGLSWADYGQLMNRAHIVVNHSIRGELNLRVFESIACGAMPMIEASNEEVDQWFTPGEDIVTYDPDRILETLAHYHANPKERDTIAARAHGRRLEWGGASRLDHIVDYAMETPSSGRPFCSYEPSTKALHTWRQFAGARDKRFAHVERRCAKQFIETHPQDARALTVEAMSLTGDDINAQAKLLYEAHRTDRGDIAFALNAASAFHAAAKPSMEKRCLEAATQAKGMANAGLVIGPTEHRFQARWRRALAQSNATPGLAQAEAQFRLAQHALSAGDIDEAEALLNKVQDIDPGHGECWAVRYAIDTHQQNYEAAAEDLYHLIQYRPMDIPLRERYIASLRSAGKGARAEEEEISLNWMRRRIV